MSIRGWFGKKMLSMMREANEVEQATQIQRTTDMERMFGNCTPAIVAFKIENGFVVRTMSATEAYEGSRASGFTYCKDHTEIAEHIIAGSVKRKLGVQGELFPETNVGQQLQSKLAAHRTLGAKSAI